MNAIRLGILQVYHDKSEIIGDRFPDDAHRFRDLFDRLDQRFRYRVYMTMGGVLPDTLDEQDAYLITGSPESVCSEPAFLPSLVRFIRACDAARKPLIGVCFGHQAIACALGGRVEKATTGWNIGVETTIYRQAPPRAWMDPPGDLDLYVFHEDQVTRIPEGCELLGTSLRNPCASFARGDHIFTTQSHPEFDAGFMSALLDLERDGLGQAVHDAARDSMKREPQGDIFAEWCCRLICQNLAGRRRKRAA